MCDSTSAVYSSRIVRLPCLLLTPYLPTSLPSRQPSADCRRASTDSSTMFQMTLHHRRPGVSRGNGSSMEQSAASDKSRQCTAAVSARDKSTLVLFRLSFLLKVKLTHHSCCRSSKQDGSVSSGMWHG